MNIVYVNGQLLPSQDVQIPLDERGLRFGDGLFETIAIHNGKPYQASLHTTRLQEGLSALSIDALVNVGEVCEQLCAANALQSGFVRLMVTRGTGSKGYIPTCEHPNIYAEAFARTVNAETSITLGLSKWRKVSSSAMPTTHKLNALGFNSSLAVMEAQIMGAQEALQLDENGRISESGSGNIFWLYQGTLYTPALSCDCLNGTTRSAIMRLSHLPLEACELPLYVLEQAEAVFVSNCNWGILPVSELLPFGWKWPTDHPDLTRLKDAYAIDIQTHCV